MADHDPVYKGPPAKPQRIWGPDVIQPVPKPPLEVPSDESYVRKPAQTWPGGYKPPAPWDNPNADE